MQKGRKAGSAEGAEKRVKPVPLLVDENGVSLIGGIGKDNLQMSKDYFQRRKEKTDDGFRKESIKTNRADSQSDA